MTSCPQDGAKDTMMDSYFLTFIFLDFMETANVQFALVIIIQSTFQPTVSKLADYLPLITF